MIQNESLSYLLKETYRYVDTLLEVSVILSLSMSCMQCHISIVASKSTLNSKLENRKKKPLQLPHFGIDLLLP
jgi:hypothetical protein